MDFISSIGYLINLTCHLYRPILNLKLRGKTQNISQLAEYTEWFCKKFELFEDDLDKYIIIHFISCQKLREKEEIKVHFTNLRE